MGRWSSGTFRKWEPRGAGFESRTTHFPFFLFLSKERLKHQKDLGIKLKIKLGLTKSKMADQIQDGGTTWVRVNMQITLGLGPDNQHGGLGFDSCQSKQ